MSENQDRMQSIMSQVINQLKARGIKVNGAAILDLNGQPNTDEPPINPFADKALKEIFEKINEKVKSASMPENTEERSEDNIPCFCPNCLKFENFEEVLGKNMNYSYSEFQVGGKTFKVKYAVDPKNGEEELVIQEQEPSTENMSRESLQEQLNLAVQNKQFNKAQLFLTALNKLKN
jgi:hypothetical protein